MCIQKIHRRPTNSRILNSIFLKNVALHIFCDGGKSREDSKVLQFHSIQNHSKSVCQAYETKHKRKGLV